MSLPSESSSDFLRDTVMPYCKIPGPEKFPREADRLRQDVFIAGLELAEQSDGRNRNAFYKASYRAALMRHILNISARSAPGTLRNIMDEVRGLLAKELTADQLKVYDAAFMGFLMEFGVRVDTVLQKLRQQALPS